MGNLQDCLIFRSWGKAGSFEEREFDYHLLAYHCLDVAAVGNTLFRKDRLLSEKFIELTGLKYEENLQLISFFLALHDLGKFSERFQNLKPELLKTLRACESNKEYTLRHDSMGFHLWNTIWNRIWDENCLCPDNLDYEIYDWNLVIDPWVKAVTGHHGKPPVFDIHGIPVNSKELFTEEDLEAAFSFVNGISRLLLEPEFNFRVPDSEADDPIEDDPIEALIDSFKKSSWLIAGLTVLSDWIGSNKHYFNYISDPMPLEDYWQNHALKKAEEALSASGTLPSVVSLKTGMEALFPDIKTPSPLQSYVSTINIENEIKRGEMESPLPQLFIIEDTTGSGKTEVALVLGHQLMSRGLANGLFIALPTMATSNAMYSRLIGTYRKFFNETSNPSLVLAHSSSYLSDEFRTSIGFKQTDESGTYSENVSGEETISAQCSEWIADSRKKALLADVGVGTVDQAIISVLPAAHQSLRVLGLSRSVLIVDEVHAYDSYMHSLLCKLLELHALLGGSAILLSATLPIKQRRELARSFCKGLGTESRELKESSYPLITQVSGNDSTEVSVGIREGTRRTVNVEFFDELERVEEKVIQLSREGKCVCWIRNTVDDAVEAYEKLVGVLGEENVGLFHARFVMGNRLEIENEVLGSFGKDSGKAERKSKVLVSTQVVEQSLDLDFDYMVSDLAPVDLLIQRAGRLQRHPEHGSQRVPVLGIFGPELTDNPPKDWYSEFFPKAAFVYPKHGQLWLTMSLLAEKGKFTVPDDLRFLIEGVFSEEAAKDIPENLKGLDEKAKGEEMADRALARLNSLDFNAGYKKSPVHWLDDTLTPTRLGEDTINVRLAKWDGGKLTPFFKKGCFSWELSQVSIKKSRLAKAGNYDKKMKTEIEKTLDSMPDKGKWSLLMPMSQAGDTGWAGSGFDERGRPVQLTYKRKTGLNLTRE